MQNAIQKFMALQRALKEKSVKYGNHRRMAAQVMLSTTSLYCLCCCKRWFMYLWFTAVPHC